MKPRVLIVDDEAAMASAISVALSRNGYRCQTCLSGERALEIFNKKGADVVVTDLRLSGMDGLELMRRLKEREGELPVILITAFGEVSSAVEAMRQGAFDYVSKPFDNEELRSLVARALQLNRLQRENRFMRRELGARYASAIIAESAGMKAVLALIDRAAPSKAPVLIQGESGTGKELIAKRLHYRSDRVAGPFVAVNCKSFAVGVLESELFGHEKGAFTGAVSSRPGCFERADGGTLFLDEIGEVDLEFQAKILRVLQESEVLRVGGERTRPVDVRIVAATNRDLGEEIQQGRFREDLFFRLNVIPVKVPPLRTRREDILPLARHFLSRQTAESGRLLELTAESEEQLRVHDWPGNVRELENAVERASVLATSLRIGPEALLLHQSVRSSKGRDAIKGTLQDYLDRRVVERIEAALSDHGGRRGEAADELGIDRSTLYRLMKRHGL